MAYIHIYRWFYSIFIESKNFID